MERGTLRMDHRWIVPGGTGIPGIEDLLRRLGDGGFAVEDPLAPRPHEERLGDAFPGPLATDYGWMMQRIYETARAIRDRNEQETLAAFWTPDRQDGDHWILVDGRLRQPLRHAAGLVKQFTVPIGSDANPKGIGIDTKGNAWATAGAESRVYAYDTNGALIGGALHDEALPARLYGRPVNAVERDNKLDVGGGSARCGSGWA